MSQLEFETTHWGETTKQVACDHLLEIANLAIKHSINVTSDYGVGDEWWCPLCDASVEMNELIEALKTKEKEEKKHEN